MTLPEVTSPFLAAGFAPEPQAPHFGQELTGANYLRRSHTYVFLCGYDPEYHANLIPRTYAEMRADTPARTHNGPREYGGIFCEAVWEVYLAPKNTRRPKGPDTKGKDDPYSKHQLAGFVPIETRLLRIREDLDSVLDIPSHSAQTG